MKPPSLRDAIEWIAWNESAGDNDPPEVLATLTTVVLVADLWDKAPIDIAKRVYKYRNPEG